MDSTSGSSRRAFLRTLGGVLVAAAAPTKTYAFFGNILRPQKKELILPEYQIVWSQEGDKGTFGSVVKGYMYIAFDDLGNLKIEQRES